jgi:hypothetical protein
MSWIDIKIEMPPEDEPVMLRIVDMDDGDSSDGFIVYAIDHHSPYHCYEGREPEPLYFSDCSYFQITHWQSIEPLDGERFCKECSSIFKPNIEGRVVCEGCVNQTADILQFDTVHTSCTDNGSV